MGESDEGYYTQLGNWGKLRTGNWGQTGRSRQTKAGCPTLKVTVHLGAPSFDFFYRRVGEYKSQPSLSL